MHRGLFGYILHVLLLYQSLSSKLTNVIVNLDDRLWVVNGKLFLPLYAAHGPGKCTTTGYELEHDVNDDKYAIVGVIKIYWATANT